MALPKQHMRFTVTACEKQKSLTFVRLFVEAHGFEPRTLCL